MSDSPIFRVTRRNFLRTAGIGGGALVFGAYFAPAAEAQGLVENLINGFPAPGVPLVKLKVNGDFVIITHRSEMGQGTRSTLAAALADDLEADWNRVTLRQADSNGYEYAVTFPFPVPSNIPDLPFPYEKIPKTQAPKKQYLINNEGAQFTDSSRSIAAYFPVVRLMGTGIRLVMIRSAAKKWGVDPTTCRAEKHRVYGPNGQSIDYRWLLLRAQKEPAPLYKDLVANLKGPEEWRYIGKGKEPMPFYDARDMVTGKTVYGADVDVPGMLTAMVERCPVANGALKYYDPKPALDVPGVRAVLPIYAPGVPGGGVGMGFMPHAGVAVVGINTWAALAGRRAIRPTIQWEYGPHRSYDSDDYRKTLKDSTSKPGNIARKKGNVDEPLTGNTVEAYYYVPHLAQTPMEPPAAVALFKNGHMEVWASTQSPDVTQMMAGKIALGDETCNIFSDKDEDTPCKDALRKAATVHVTLLGGGFGRKSKPDFVVEAAILAKQMPGVPIRIQWTREDDVRFSYYNAVSSQYLKAALGSNGLPTALLQRSALTSFFGSLFPNRDTWGLKPADIDLWQKRRRDFLGSGEYPYASGIERAQGLEDMPFDVPNIRTENCPAENHIRVGWMRSVANIYHAFGICSFADEMAIKAGSDNHKNYLLDLIGPGRNLYKDPASGQGLITEVTEQFGLKQYRNNELPLEDINVRDPDNGGKMTTVVPGYPPDTSRLRAVIEQVAKDSDWDNKIKQYKNMKGRGLGIAGHRSFLSYVAIVVDVTLTDKGNEKELTINDIWGAIHCGLAVNRDRVIAQMQGGMLYGLSYALLGEITVKQGEVQQNNFDDYQVLRIHQTPRVHVSIVDSLEPPTGVGEPPSPAVAPALANAIVAAGGPRIQEIPFKRFVKVMM
jgi:isoquinoline 1-oxidoreductase beta subunit